MGAGFNAAGESVTDIMGKGRTEASAERRLAQQLSLQAREGQREQAMQETALKRDNLVALATMESDTQAKAEERKYRSEQAAQAASYQASQLQLARERGELDAKQFNYGLYATANKLINDNAIALTGPRPDKDEIAEYKRKASVFNGLTKTDGKGNKIDERGKVVPKPINPEAVWTQDYMGNVAQQAQVIAPEFGLDASIFSPTPPAAPASAPKYKVGQVLTIKGKRYKVTGGDMVNDPDLEPLK
jgi:LysM repeat protein